jgi:hypothetical protein
VRGFSVRHLGAGTSQSARERFVDSRLDQETLTIHPLIQHVPLAMDLGEQLTVTG